MQKDNYWRQAKLKSVVDGDTVRLLIDLGYRNYTEYAIRLDGIISPKFYRGVPEEERIRGIRTRNFVVQWFRQHSNTCSSIMEQWPFMIVTIRADGGSGRYLGRIYCLKEHCLNDDLLESGLVRPFLGEVTCQ